MKRSEINNVLERGIGFMKQMQFKLPPFAFWSPDDWNTKGKEYEEITENLLGWDITDFGSGDFNKCGLLLFTLRNGNISSNRSAKTYAEKILIVEEGQSTPYHYHSSKMEDIINRGGGNLLIQLYNSTENGHLADTDVKIASDGRNYTVSAGTIITLEPGESITLFPKVYHQFWGEEGKGRILVGEVSNVNNDKTDNYFLEQRGRFPSIVEDVPPLHLLVSDYATMAQDLSPAK